MVNLDVLVVYSANPALSASVTDAQSRCPFPLESAQANYNLPYAYFLQTCQKSALRAGFTTSSDIIGPGTCRNYWANHGDDWVKVRQAAQSGQIFDKIAPTTPRQAAARRLLFSDQTIRPLNNRELCNTFFDKLLTYQQLPRYTIPTVAVTTKQATVIAAARKKLKLLVQNHPYPEDFTKQLVLKDRFGCSGEHVYRIKQNFTATIQQIMRQNPTIQFVLQPFLAFEHGFAYQRNQTATDLRLIFQHNQLLQCYLRMAKGQDFRCNEHQGGQLVYVTPAEIPAKVHAVSQKIVAKINRPGSLFALDFVISNTGRIYFMEGNSRPGLDWNVNKKVNEKMSKQLIRNIVREFARRLDNPVLLEN